MAKPLTDLLQVLRRVFRFGRYLGVVFLAITLWIIGREVAGAYRTVAAIDPYLGYGFLALVGLLVFLLLGLPIYRFLRMPVVVSPPKLPDKVEEWKYPHLKKQVEYLEKYLKHLRGNPAFSEHREALAGVQRELGMVASDIKGVENLREARAILGRFEKDEVNVLLKPLDKEVDGLIRAEALAVGVATAISHNGALDAFILLWRNANLVSRIANVYYGRPGVRGSFRILRDVSAAALLATYLEGLTEAAGGILRGIFGSIVGTVAGPLLNGSVNAVATLRIGYLAKARCRSFKAWTEATKRKALADALAAARERSRGVVAELAKAVGGSIVGITNRVGGAVKDGISSLVKKMRGEDQDRPEPQPAE